ncbi:MAG: UxaA family hydrolase [Cyclobacteriaceae bacterium]
MNKAITINKEDNVAVALVDLAERENVTINDLQIELVNNISLKHKFALRDFQEGDEIIMYGVTVGVAGKSIPKGGAITTENISHKSADYEVNSRSEYQWQPPDFSRWQDTTFMGYHRSDGQVGTANIWLVFPLVFCENRNIEIIKKAFEKGLGLEEVDKYESLVRQLVSHFSSNDLTDEVLKAARAETLTETTIPRKVFDNIDGIRFLTHQGGCGGIRQDSETLCRLLAGYVNNPNVGGVTVLSLGCQNAEITQLKEALNRVNPNMDKPILIYDQQQVGTEEELVSTAIKDTFLGLTKINKIERRPAPLSKLSIGLECGGSDGFSGISANPTVGQVSDLMTALGGKTILSEFPELCGVEQELINRSPDPEVAKKFAHLMRTYEKMAIDAGSGFDMNPSPGNIKDGLITDAMKSAGAAKKGGTSPVMDVLDYTEYAKEPGLNLLCTPGNDVESTTGLAGSGANIILFTTGLGTPTGNPAAPVIKISSHTQLAKRMPDIIDVDTGPIITGEKTIEDMGAVLLDYIIEVASGRLMAKADQLQQYDFIPWKRGVSL